MANKRIWTFGTLRSFFHGEKPASAARFMDLFDGMMRAHESNPAEVVEEWLPYALEHLEAWPIGERQWQNGVWWDQDTHQDTFTLRAHPLHMLGRFLFVEDVSAEDLVRYCSAPDIDQLVSLEFFWPSNVTAEHLERALGALKRASLQELGQEGFGFDLECAAVMERATHLDSLVSLEISSHKLTWRQLRDMLRSPHLAGLRHLGFGDVPGYGDFFAKFQLQMLELLPDLETTLAPHNQIAWHARAPTWREVPAPEEKCARARLDIALAPYRDSDDTHYPFLGEGWQSYSDFVELSEEAFWSENLSLEDVFPDAIELAQGDYYNITTIYVVAVREGAIEAAFDENGELVRALELRAIGKCWNGPPPGRDEARYNGECFLQTRFAQFGLHLEQGEDGMLRLLPGRDAHMSALMRFWSACHAVERWVGGDIIEYCCTPWHEPLGMLVEPGVDVRATIVWEEDDHRFDRFGELTGPQQISCQGDVVPLFRVLGDMGFEVGEGRWENSFTISQRASEDQT